MRKQYLILLGLLVVCSVSWAQSYQTHTYYIYAFTQNITWPDEDSGEDFKIGIVGESPITVPLQKLATLKKVNNQLIKIITFANVDEIKKCNILFLPQDQSQNLKKTLDIVGDQSMLLVTEKEGLATKGSAINFVMKNNKLAFEINNDAVNKANLQVAAQLKKYAIQL